MRYHRYKGRSGGYFRGRSSIGRYYTRPGCMIQVLMLIIVVLGILLLV